MHSAKYWEPRANYGYGLGAARLITRWTPFSGATTCPTDAPPVADDEHRGMRTAGMMMGGTILIGFLLGLAKG